MRKIPVFGKTANEAGTSSSAASVGGRNGLKLPQESEKEFMAQVMQFAKIKRWWIYHTHDSRRSAKGFPDLVLVRERIVFAECKRNDGRLTAEQSSWVAWLHHAGAEVYVWRPMDFEEVMKILA